MPKRSGITLFQLFFLSFSYVFSGLFLIRETAFLSLLFREISKSAERRSGKGSFVA